MFKIILFLFFIFNAKTYGNEDVTLVNLKNLDSMNKNIKYNKFIDIYEGKVEIDQDPDKIYLFSNERYYTEIAYSAQFRELSNRNKEFFTRWLEAKYWSNNSAENNNLDTKRTLINNQLNLFYKELMIVSEGKIFNFIVQGHIAKKMARELSKNDKIQVELLYLGKNYLTGTNFFVITNFSKNSNISLSGNKSVKEDDFIKAKRMINSGQYDAALVRLNNFLKKNPNHLEARKDVCFVKYLNSTKIYNNKVLIAAIACYEDLLNVYKTGEIYYTLATMYYSLGEVEGRYNKILEYSSNAVDYLKKEGKDKGTNQVLYCNALYLEGIAKLALKNNDGLMDIEHAQNKCPELINIDIFSND